MSELMSILTPVHLPHGVGQVFLCKMFLTNLMDSSVFFIFAVVVVGMVGTSLAVVFKFSTLLCSSHSVLVLVVEVACNLSAHNPGFYNLVIVTIRIN